MKKQDYIGDTVNLTRANRIIKDYIVINHYDTSDPKTIVYMGIHVIYEIMRHIRWDSCYLD